VEKKVLSFLPSFFFFLLLCLREGDPQEGRRRTKTKKGKKSKVRRNQIFNAKVHLETE
jgi:hypothetical protein